MFARRFTLLVIVTTVTTGLASTAQAITAGEGWLWMAMEKGGVLRIKHSGSQISIKR